MRKTRQPRFYFSFRSPYSWLAYRDLMACYQDLAARLEWRPFFEPDLLSERLLLRAGGRFPYVAMSREKNFYILQDVDRLRRARGLEITWPADRDPVWEIPHLAYLAATDQGRGPEFIARVYQARWQEGRDICAPDTIAELAAELGLDQPRLAGAAGDDEMRQRGVSALLDIDHDGVFGVPFFISGFNKFWGVDRLAAFADLMRDPQRPARGGGPAASGLDVKRGADEGHAGGCG
jgi:2-hydroxychromene-2-carboxylate isomerase